MELMNKLKKFAGVRTAAGFMLVSLLICAISIFVITRPKEEFAETTAVITEIISEYNASNDGYDYTVFVDYSVGGTKYTHASLGAYDSSMKEGKEITIEYCVSDPERIQAVGSENIPYIIAAVAGIVFAVSTVCLVKAIKKPSEEYSQLDRVDVSSASEEEIKAVETSNETLKKYYFHFDSSKLKQGHVMENEAHDTVYEGKLLQFSLLGDSTYEFVNHVTSSSKQTMIGHVVTKSVGDGFASLPISSAFKIDGTNCWEYIGSHGFSLEYSLNGLKAHYEIFHWGVNVGCIDSTSAKLYEEDEAAASKLITKLPATGFYRIMCRESDLDDVFFICFALTKAALTQNS